LFVFYLYDPAIVLSMLMLSFIFLIECGLFDWKRNCAGFLLFVYIGIVIGEPFIRGGFLLFVYIGIVIGEPFIREGGLGSFCVPMV